MSSTTSVARWPGWLVITRQVCYLDCTRDIGHVVRHHLDVGTVEDSDTAARGQTLYSFAPKSRLAHDDRLPEDRVGTRWKSAGTVDGRSGTRLWKAIFAQTVFQALVYESAVGRR